MPRWAAPPAPSHRPHRSDADSWGLVIKVQYLSSIKRLNAYVDGSHFDHDLAALRSKIGSAFNFSPDAEFILTYADEDGDIVMLDDDSDLQDAAFDQKLNPLRIYVQLKGRSVGVPHTKQQVSNSRSSISSTLEDQLAQVKSAIDEALNFIPEKVPIALTKLSHDLRSKAASAPSLADLLDRFAKLLTPKGNMQPSSGHYCLFGSSSEGPDFVTVSASQPSEILNSESSKALGLKSVVNKDIKAQAEQASGYPLVYDACSSGGEKVALTGSTDAHINGETHTPSNRKSAVSSNVPPIATIAHGVPTVRSAPAPSMGENTLSDLQSKFPPLPYYPLRAYSCNPLTSSVTPYKPYPKGVSTGGVYPFGGSYRDVSNNYGSVPECTFHRGIVCNGCEVTPIAGPRYKSTVKYNYDLCSACFSHMGNEAEYTRIDRPSLVNQSLIGTKKDERIIPKLQQGSHDCGFVKDITIPDGTVLAPSTSFTKIWRIRNSGSTMWPFGTHLVWIDGHHFAAQQNSVILGISVDGFPVNQEIDVGVEFITPAKPGRYISYWRMALPSGQKFGRGVWVDIQVEQPVQTSNKQHAAINLNLPPFLLREGNSNRGKIVIDMDVKAVEPITYDSYTGNTSDDWLAHALSHEAVKLNTADPVLSAAPSSTAAEPLEYGTSSTTSAPAVVPAAPEAISLPTPVSLPAHTSVHVLAPAPASSPAPAPVHAPASVLASPPPNEEMLLRELFDMGFTQVDLNREILRQNKYDLQQAVDDLCDFDEWDSLTDLMAPVSDGSEIYDLADGSVNKTNQC